MNRLACVVALAVVPWCVTGCKDSSSTAPGLVSVKGTVTLDGKPMAGGEVRFTAPGQSLRTVEIKDGAFSGQAYPGKNRVDVVWDQDGPPNPMDPSSRIKVNTVAPQFWGPNSKLSADVGTSGATDLKFDVTSVKK
jgi:hypothetical protein